MVADVQGTAVLETADTAGAPEAPPQETAPETASPLTSPETAQPEAPETGAPKNPLDDLDEASLLEHPKVKGILAKREESARRRAESARAQADLEWAQKQGYVNDFAEVLRGSIVEDEDGQATLRLDPKKVGAITDRLWTSQVRGAIGAVSSIVSDRLGKDFNLSNEDAERLRDTYATFTADPVNEGAAYLSAVLDIVEKAAISRREPEIRKEIERAVRKEVESEFEARKRKEAETADRAKGNATPVQGVGAASYNLKTVGGIVQAHRNGAITDAEKVKYLREL